MSEEEKDEIRDKLKLWLTLKGLTIEDYFHKSITDLQEIGFDPCAICRFKYSRDGELHDCSMDDKKILWVTDKYEFDICERNHPLHGDHRCAEWIKYV